MATLCNSSFLANLVGFGCNHCVLYKLAHLNDDVDYDADDSEYDDDNDDDRNRNDSDDEENARAYYFCVMLRSRRLTKTT